MTDILSYEFVLYFLNTFGVALLVAFVVLELLVYLAIFLVVRHVRRKKIR